MSIRLAYIRGQLLSARETGAAAVPIAWMLDLIEGRPPPAVPAQPQPDVDPVTGCLPVTAKPEDA